MDERKKETIKVDKEISAPDLLEAINQQKEILGQEKAKSLKQRIFPQ